MQLHPIPALADNYIWLLHDAHGHAVVVDPGETEPVLRELSARGLTLTDILLTHHHADHAGGSVELAQACGARIIGPADERIARVDLEVADGAVIRLPGAGWRFNVLATPGHTRSHVVYYGEGLLFSGDTLFSLGCGRLFEGSPAEMLSSLDRLSVLPAQTRVCCAHEYTLANAAFARGIEPDNASLRAREEEVRELRARGLPSLPVELASEKLCNPFLRVDSPAIRDWAQARGVGADRTSRFAALRAAKDRFRA